jgi:hypothetical protein
MVVKRELAVRTDLTVLGILLFFSRAAIEDSKKWGMLNLVNQLFKIYFKINKLHLCKPLIRAIDSLPIKDRFSKSQLVTYR